MSLAPRHKSVAAYNYGAMLLHWLLALLIIAELSIGYLMKHYTVLPSTIGSAFYQSRFTFYQLHKTFGVIILLLALMRLTWRFLYKPPAELPIGKAEKAATQIVTFLFYALMILVPLLGWAVSSTSSKKLPILLFDNPHLVWPLLPPQLTPFSHLQAEWLHLMLAYSLVFLLFLHICGALKHQFYDHMPIMARMVPGRGLRAQPAGKTAFLLLFLAVLCLSGVMVYCGFTRTRQAQTEPAPVPAIQGSSAAPLPGQNLPAQQQNAALAAALAYDSANWAIDYRQSTITYAIEVAGVMKNGAIGAWRADIRFDPNRPEEAKAAITLDSNSVSYKAADIMAKDGVAAAQYPHMQVVLGQFGRHGRQPDHYQAKGTVTIRDVVQPLTVDFRFNEQKGRAIIDGRADLNRLAFNPGRENDPQAKALGKIIHVKFHLIANKKPAAQRRQAGSSASPIKQQ